MSNYSKNGEEVSFVALGHFNPGIFHPEWFRRHDLVADEDLDPEQINFEVVHPEVTRFSSWFNIEVTPARLVLSTKKIAKSQSLRDLVADIFRILCETPVTSIGMNRTFRYSCASDEAWHNIGHTLAPRKVWLKSAPNASHNPGDVGMRSVEMQLKRWDVFSEHGYLRIYVAPIAFRPQPEAAFRYNDHIEYKAYAATNASTSIAEVVTEHWDRFMLESKRMIDDLLTNIEAENVAE